MPRPRPRRPDGGLVHCASVSCPALPWSRTGRRWCNRHPRRAPAATTVRRASGDWFAGFREVRLTAGPPGAARRAPQELLQARGKDFPPTPEHLQPDQTATRNSHAPRHRLVAPDHYRTRPHLRRDRGGKTGHPDGRTVVPVWRRMVEEDSVTRRPRRAGDLRWHDVVKLLVGGFTTKITCRPPGASSCLSTGPRSICPVRVRPYGCCRGPSRPSGPARWGDRIAW